MSVCQQIFELGLGEHSKRQEEVDQFWGCVEDAKKENKVLGMVSINNFLESKKRVSYSPL